MAKTAAKTMDEVAVITTGDPSKARAERREGAQWFGANADRRTKVDKSVADRMLAEAVKSRASGFNARTFALEAGLLVNKSGQPDKMGNPTGTITLAYNAGGVMILCEQHDQKSIADSLRTAWNTLPDGKLRGANGAIQAAKDALKAQGIGVRKAADRSKTTEEYSLAWVVKVFAGIVNANNGGMTKVNGRKLPGFNALPILKMLIAGETPTVAGYKRIGPDIPAGASTPQRPARPARKRTAPRSVAAG